MIKNLIETIFVFVLFALIPSVIMMLSGSIGPMMLLIGLMILDYILFYFIKEN